MFDQNWQSALKIIVTCTLHVHANQMRIRGPESFGDLPETTQLRRSAPSTDLQLGACCFFLHPVFYDYLTTFNQGFFLIAEYVHALCNFRCYFVSRQLI
jgi:hypothetical protein